MFGDESQSHGMVTYAFVIIPTINLPHIEAEILRIKSEFGLSANDQIHCKQLFHSDQRAKTGFNHLHIDQIFDFIQKLMEILFTAGARGWVGYLNASKSPDILFFEENGTGKKDSWDIRDIKLKMLFAYEAAMAPLTHFISPDNVFAWVDGDVSKVKHFQQSRKMNSLRSFFPVEHDDKKFVPLHVNDNKPTLLQIADVLAYASAQALSTTHTKNKHKFISIVNALKPGYSEVIFDITNGGPVMSIRSYDPFNHIKDFIKSFIT